MIRLIPIYDSQALVSIWPTVSTGVQKISDIGNDCSLEYVFNELFAGRSLLWVCFDESNYIGFVITQVINLPPSTRYLLLYQVFVKPGSQKDVLELGGAQIEKYARESGCQYISMFTRREAGFEKRLSLMNWHKGLVEFRKELKEVL